MTTHKLKTLPKYFQNTIEGKKPFEVRLNDRDYKVGDTVVLEEWENGKYSGREIGGKIDYILNDFIGLKDGYIAFTLCCLDYCDNCIYSHCASYDYPCRTCNVLGLNQLEVDVKNKKS